MSEHGHDNEKFKLAVADGNTGGRLSPETCPHCGKGHYFVLETERAPTFSFVNTFDDTVTARVIVNHVELLTVFLKPGEEYRVFGGQIDFLMRPIPLWGGKVEVIFRKVANPQEIEIAEAELLSALQDFSRSLKAEEPDVLAQIIMHVSRDTADTLHNGRLSFSFLNEETWELIREVSVEVDTLLQEGLTVEVWDVTDMLSRPRREGKKKKARSNRRKFNA